MSSNKPSDELSSIIHQNKLEDELDELRGGAVNESQESNLVNEIGVEGVD
jgi:hypothetical protein